MKKLISMTDFVLEQKETYTLDYPQIMWYQYEITKLNKIRNYANLLKQPLELWMFVPCDDNGNIKKEPLKRDYNTVNINNSYFKEYQQAKERCLFEGFVIKDCLLINKKNIIVINYLSDKTIEHIVNNEIELTETAIKQIGL